MSAQSADGKQINEQKKRQEKAESKKKDKDIEILGDNIAEQVSKQMMKGNKDLMALMNTKIPKKIEKKPEAPART